MVNAENLDLMEKLISVQIVVIELQKLLRHLSEIRKVMVLNPQTPGMKRIVNLPKYEMKKPDDKGIRTLRIIADKGGKITKKEAYRQGKNNCSWRCQKKLWQGLIWNTRQRNHLTLGKCLEVCKD